MLRSVVLFVVVLMLPQLAYADTYYSYSVKGIRYQSTVTEETANNTPSWTENEDNPPLTARRALELATAKKDRLTRNDQGWQWYFDEMSLHRFASTDKWYWLATFHGSQAGDIVGAPPTIRLIVLMDGTIPEPVVAGPPVIP